MQNQDSPEYIDAVAQAVIDKIADRERLELTVSLVAQRVLEMQKEHAEAALEEAAPNEE